MSTTATKERPILFSAAMVRAILARQKTMTRRIMNPQPVPTPVGYSFKGQHYFGFNFEEQVAIHQCPYGRVGNRLWVKETWATDVYYDGRPGNGCGPIPEGVAIECRESPDAVKTKGLPHRTIQDRGRWRPSIHMYRWASRITLEITGVKVERLQSISERDAMAEGVERLNVSPDFLEVNGEQFPVHPMTSTYAAAFEKLWGKINGECSWAANPWVWCISFRRADSIEVSP